MVLSPRHSGKVEGLCGDFDGNYNNDFDDLLTGNIAATANDFARLWKTSPSCPDPDVPLDYDPCSVSAASKITVVLKSHFRCLTWDQFSLVRTYFTGFG